MIISRGRGYIFVHIPKTGGTSLATALEGRALKDDILIGDTPKARKRRGRLKDLNARGRLWKHARLCDVEGVVSAAEMRALFVFTLVRNPWDRMVSYYHWLGAQSFEHPAVASAQRNDFTGFLNDPAVLEGLRAESYGGYVSDASGEDCCDAFIRLEHIEADLAPVEEHLDFALSPLPHVNASARDAGYRDAYSGQDEALIAQLYAREIDQFGYSF
jgi:hypothetical protein